MSKQIEVGLSFYIPGIKEPFRVGSRWEVVSGPTMTEVICCSGRKRMVEHYVILVDGAHVQVEGQFMVPPGPDKQDTPQPTAYERMGTLGKDDPYAVHVPENRDDAGALARMNKMATFDLRVKGVFPDGQDGQ